jgi:hypothetical protein
MEEIWDKTADLESGRLKNIFLVPQIRHTQSHGISETEDMTAKREHILGSFKAPYYDKVRGLARPAIKYGQSKVSDDANQPRALLASAVFALLCDLL